MGFLTKIKLGNITSLADARYAAAAGVDFMGFCFDPAHASYIPPIKAREIIGWTTGNELVAEFGDQSTEEINTITELLEIGTAEISNTLPAESLKELHAALIKKVDLAAYQNMDAVQQAINEYQPSVDAFHLYHSGSGLPDETALTKLCAQHKIIWGLPVHKENVLHIINHIRPYAINISAGMEEKTGIRDFDELNELLDLIRTEDE